MRPQGYDFDVHDGPAGPLQDPGPSGVHRVQYRGLPAGGLHRIRAVLPIAVAPLVTAVLLWCLLRPGGGAGRDAGERWLVPFDRVMLASFGCVAFFLFVHAAWLAHAAAVARDPVPVTPEPGIRAAFLTTYVPGREPLAPVRTTLEAAVRLRRGGQPPFAFDVWLLDEGDDAAARALCAELGVRHFTRRGVPEWNRPEGAHQARARHGNHNAWLAMYGDLYDVLAAVGAGHVPQPGLLERTLGCFRDPDVAFVVGPQVYADRTSPLTKAAESRQLLFHGLIQRAGNRYGAPLLAGGASILRIGALRQAGGFQDSLTGGMATGFEIHRRRNPLTGGYWRSVHTPDALAVVPGPESWTEFFAQRTRCSRGAYEMLSGRYWKGLFRMPPGRLLNYTLVLAHYPMTVFNWLLGVLGPVLFLWLGASGIRASSEVWLMLCGDAVALLVRLHWWNRRHNVISRGSRGSGALAGVGMSALCAPVHLLSLVAAVTRPRGTVAVTPEPEATARGGAAPDREATTKREATAGGETAPGGEAAAGGGAGTRTGTDGTGPDRLTTFRPHLFWAGLLGASLVASAFLGHADAAMRTCAALALAVSLAPVAIWLWTDRRERITARLRAVLPRGGGPGAVRAATAAASKEPSRGGRHRVRPARQPRGATTFRTAQLRTALTPDTAPGSVAPTSGPERPAGAGHIISR